MTTWTSNFSARNESVFVLLGVVKKTLDAIPFRKSFQRLRYTIPVALQIKDILCQRFDTTCIDLVKESGKFTPQTPTAVFISYYLIYLFMCTAVSKPLGVFLMQLQSYQIGKFVKL